MTLSGIHIKLYIDLLESLSLQDTSLSDAIENISLATIFTEPSKGSHRNVEEEMLDSNAPSSQPNSPRKYGAFQESELIAFGMRARYHLDLSARKRLIEEIRSTLHCISQFMDEDYQGLENEDDLSSRVPDLIQAQKDEIADKRQQITWRFKSIANLILQITEIREDLESEVNTAISVTLPAHTEARSSSIDLLAATIEISLVKLSLTRARANRALYTQCSQQTDDESNNMAKAVKIASSALKSEEREMRIEAHSLDQQLKEYESLLQLVDGGKGGYQQIVNDWTKVKQETDECLKDIRRLGWTGD